MELEPRGAPKRSTSQLAAYTEETMRSLVTVGLAAVLMTGSAWAQPATNRDRTDAPAPAAQAQNPTPNPGRAAPNELSNPPSAPSASTPSTNTAAPPAGALPANKGPSNPAIKTSEGNNPGAPVAGANSFTEGQAKARIESRGYSNVSALTKDDRGVWRGMAMKDGKPVQVALDYQGNVTVN
jgi:hypothetical protein